VYKTLGFKWLIQAFCPASAFVSADRDEARNPQRLIHATVMCQPPTNKSFFTEFFEKMVCQREVPFSFKAFAGKH
jgi:hypothetical protein